MSEPVPDAKTQTRNAWMIVGVAASMILCAALLSCAIGWVSGYRYGLERPSEPVSNGKTESPVSTPEKSSGKTEVAGEVSVVGKWERSNNTDGRVLEFFPGGKGNVEVWRFGETEIKDRIVVPGPKTKKRIEFRWRVEQGKKPVLITESDEDHALGVFPLGKKSQSHIECDGNTLTVTPFYPMHSFMTVLRKLP